MAVQAAALDGLFTALQGIYAASLDAMGEPIQVSRGPADVFLAGSVVSVLGCKSPIVRPTMSPSRSRETALAVDIEISVYLQGGNEVQSVVDDAAWNLEAPLEAYFRTSPNERLGLVAPPVQCYDSWLESAEHTPDIYWVFDDPAQPPVAAGRFATIECVAILKLRY